MSLTLSSVLEDLIRTHGGYAVLEAVETYDGITEDALATLLTQQSAEGVLNDLGVVPDEDPPAQLAALVESLHTCPPLPGITPPLYDRLAARLLLVYAETHPEWLATMLVRTCGESVVRITWDSNFPGASKVDAIYRLGQSYWYHGDDGTFGPVASLPEAITTYRGVITSTTESISSDVLTADQLLALFTLDESVRPGQRVWINGNRYVMDLDGQVRPFGWTCETQMEGVSWLN